MLLVETTHLLVAIVGSLGFVFDGTTLHVRMMVHSSTGEADFAMRPHGVSWEDHLRKKRAHNKTSYQRLKKQQSKRRRRALKRAAQEAYA